MKSCFLFGHADCPDHMMPRIEKAIENHYLFLGITSFYVGNHGRFDQMAAAAVKKLKQKYPDLRLYLLLSYHPSEKPVRLTDGFDGSFYPPLENVPRRFAIVRANRYMVASVDSIICCVSHIGNSRTLLEYALRRHIAIVNVAENT